MPLASVAMSQASTTADPVAGDHRDDIDVLRVIAAVMVLTIHASSSVIFAAEQAPIGGTYWVAVTLNALSRCAVPVFLAIGGWLLLRRPVPDSTDWLGSRIARLGIPLLVWSAIYLVEEAVKGGLTGARTWQTAGQAQAWVHDRLVDLLAGPGVRTHLWYLYVAIAITVVVWVVQATRLQHRDPATVSLAAVALVLPFGLASMVHETIWWGAAAIWAVGYSVIGYVEFERPPRRLIAGLLYLAGVGGIVAAVRATGYDTWSSSYPTPMALAATVGLLGLIMGVRVPQSMVHPLRVLGSLTLGFYLVHPLVLDVFRVMMLPGGPLDGLPLLPGLALLLVAGVTVSFLVTWSWHRSPMLVRLLG